MRIYLLLLLFIQSVYSYADNVRIFRTDELLNMYLTHANKSTLQSTNKLDSQWDSSMPVFDIVPSEATDSTPPYSMYVKRGFSGNTLNGSNDICWSNEITMTVYSDVPCNVYLFNRNEPQKTIISTQFNHFYDAPWNPMSNYTRKFPLVATSPTSTKYDVVVTSLNGNKGYAVVYVTGNDSDAIKDDGTDYIMANGWVLPSEFYVPDSLRQINIFTAHSDSTCDPKILAFYNNNNVKYCDNFTENSLYHWGKNAQITFNENEVPRKFIVYSRTPTMNTDVFIAKRINLNKTDIFPLMDKYENDFCESAPASNMYNCGGWALQSWNKWRWPSVPVNWLTNTYYNEEDSITGLDRYFYLYGLQREGANSDNADIDVWAFKNEFTHLSVRCYNNPYSYGPGFESKIGSRERILHPRYGLTCDKEIIYPNGESNCPYGHVDHHLRYQNINTLLSLQFNNSEFTDEEKEKIARMVSLNSQSDKVSFEKAFRRLNNIANKNGVSNFHVLNTQPAYKSIVAMCTKKPLIIGLILQKLAENNLLASELISATTRSNAKPIIKKLRELDHEDINKTYKIRTPMSIAIGYAKLLLSGGPSVKPMNLIKVDFPEQLNINNSGNEIIVSNRGNISGIKLQLFNQYATWCSLLLTLNSDNSVTITVPQTGLYILNVRYDDETYSKKIYVK